MKIGYKVIIGLVLLGLALYRPVSLIWKSSLSSNKDHVYYATIIDEVNTNSTNGPLFEYHFLSKNKNYCTITADIDIYDNGERIKVLYDVKSGNNEVLDLKYIFIDNLAILITYLIAIIGLIGF